MTKSELKISQEGGVGKYLRLPEHFGRRKRDLFTSIVEKIKLRSLSWKSKHLSTAGKQVMTKSVLSSIPSYTMSCFMLPLSLCNRIQSSLPRFWWDKNSDKKGMSWISWKKLTRSKSEGRLGFRDIHSFNKALVAKLSWRLIEKPNSLLAQLLLTKYCKEKDFLQVSAGQCISHGWRSILACCDLMRDQLGWALGDGTSVNLWTEHWLSTTLSTRVFGPANKGQENLKVADLVSAESEDKLPIRTRVLRHHESTPKSICCNTDAAWSHASGNTGLGWIFSQKGNTLKKGFESALSVSSPLMTEALAIRRALQEPIEEGFESIEMKSDSLTMVKAITEGLQISEIYGVLNDISDLLKAFNSISFLFINRELNVEADRLAKSGLCSQSKLINDVEIGSCLTKKKSKKPNTTNVKKNSH